MTQESNFVSLGIPVGSSRLTVTAQDTVGLLRHLNDLNEIDDGDPENPISPISAVIDHVLVIEAAATVKFGLQAPKGNSSPTAPSNAAPSCDHGVMRWKTGVTKSGQNAGKSYEGYFCTAPYGTQQCRSQQFR